VRWTAVLPVLIDIYIVPLDSSTTCTDIYIVRWTAVLPVLIDIYILRWTAVLPVQNK